MLCDKSCSLGSLCDLCSCPFKCFRKTSSTVQAAGQRCTSCQRDLRVSLLNGRLGGTMPPYICCNCSSPNPRSFPEPYTHCQTCGHKYCIICLPTLPPTSPTLPPRLLLHRRVIFTGSRYENELNTAEQENVPVDG